MLFGLGTAVITMVGINVGAGQVHRARKITWIGVLIAFIFATSIGAVVAIFPNLWLTIFSDEPQILAIGTSYLHTIAPFYGFIAAAMILYFAAIGMKRVLWPVLAGTVRMIIAAFIGWVAVTQFNVGPQGLFYILVVSILAYWAITVISMVIITRPGRHTHSNQ